MGEDIDLVGLLFPPCGLGIPIHRLYKVKPSQAQRLPLMCRL